MFRTIIISFLGGLVVAGILWFFIGRTNIYGLQETAKQISDSNKQAQQTANIIGTRYDKITITVAELNNRSADIENISGKLTNRSGEITTSIGKIESGLKDFKITTDRIENRNRQVISIIGELRKTNEDFYVGIKKYEGEK